MPISLDYREELYHHGILGQKWGVRRYQNKDGSLTSAGKKKYGTKSNFEKVQTAKRAAEKANSPEAKARAKANARTQAEIDKYRKKAGLKPEVEKPKTESTKPKTKSLSEMTDEEINQAINRKRLEDQYRAAFPKQISKGEKFMNAAKDLAISTFKDKAQKLAADFVDKKAREYLGLADTDSAKKVYEKLKLEADTLNQKKLIKEYKEALSGNGEKESDRLKKEAQDYENRTKIDKGQKYFKEGNYTESAEETDTRAITSPRLDSSKVLRIKKAKLKHSDEWAFTGEKWAESFFDKG